LYVLFEKDSKVGARRRETGSQKFLAKNYLWPNPFCGTACGKDSNGFYIEAIAIAEVKTGDQILNLWLTNLKSRSKSFYLRSCDHSNFQWISLLAVSYRSYKIR
jgi:hypothetical protein